MSEITPQPFILGVNYWPRRKAMYWWLNFDADEVRQEFDQIRDLGLNLVRIFLLWEDWQPTPTSINAEALDHLEQVCDIAQERDLRLDVTFFTGHMSGPSWTPGWMLRRDLPVPAGVRQVVVGDQAVDCGYDNPFADPVVLRAEELLLATVVARFKDHPAIAIWNLGNEPDLFAWPPGAAAGRRWALRMSSLIKEIDFQHLVTCGLHVASLVQDNGLRVNDIFAEADLAVMHGYPMYADWARGPLDADFVPFLCALTTALSGKPTLMEEFGGCTTAPGHHSTTLEWTSYGRRRQQFMASEEDLAEYFEQVLPKLVEVGALGALTWCYADYAPELYDLPPCDESWHERYFGLVRPDGTLKPHAAVIQRFTASQPVVKPALRRVSLDIAPEEYYLDPLHHARKAYQNYLGNAQ